MEAPRIETVEELDRVIAASDSGPLFLLKHSTRCPVSSAAYREFHDFVAEVAPAQAQLAIVYVVEDRPISNEIATRFDVRHESPQVFLIHKRQVVWHDSHARITKSTLLNQLAQVA